MSPPRQQKPQIKSNSLGLYKNWHSILCRPDRQSYIWHNLLQYLARQHRLHIFIRDTRFFCASDALDTSDEDDDDDDNNEPDALVLVIFLFMFLLVRRWCNVVPGVLRTASLAGLLRDVVVEALYAQRPHKLFQQ